MSMVLRSIGPIPKVIVVVYLTILVLVACIHHAATADATDSVNNVVGEKRIRHRNNLVTSKATTRTTSSSTTYLVSFSDNQAISPAKQCATLAKSLGGTVHHVYQHVMKGCSLTLPAAKAQMAYISLSNYDAVQTVELDQPIFLADDAMEERNNNMFDSSTTTALHLNSMEANAAVAPSWGLDRINQCSLPLDNTVTKQNAAGVKVFTIDTGIYAGHNEFANGVIVPGSDCHLSVFSNESPLTDAIGHG
jgi:hypothetical protein